MGVREVTYYQAECDCCGVICDDFGQFSAMIRPEHVADELPEDWARVGMAGDEEFLCPECWCWPDGQECPEGIAECRCWENAESDEPLRKGCTHDE